MVITTMDGEEYSYKGESGRVSPRGVSPRAEGHELSIYAIDGNTAIDNEAHTMENSRLISEHPTLHFPPDALASASKAASASAT